MYYKHTLNVGSQQKGELPASSLARRKHPGDHTAPQMLLLAFLPSESFTPSACTVHHRSAAPRAAILASEADGPSPAGAARNPDPGLTLTLPTAGCSHP